MCVAGKIGEDGVGSVSAKNMDLLDSARFMALFSVATADAMIAVFDAKYKYEFWRPITAIRNGDIDGNPATERDATWQPIAVSTGIFRVHRRRVAAQASIWTTKQPTCGRNKAIVH